MFPPLVEKKSIFPSFFINLSSISVFVPHCVSPQIYHSGLDIFTDPYCVLDCSIHAQQTQDACSTFNNRSRTGRPNTGTVPNYADVQEWYTRWVLHFKSTARCEPKDQCTAGTRRVNQRCTLLFLQAIVKCTVGSLSMHFFLSTGLHASIYIYILHGLAALYGAFLKNFLISSDQ